MDDAKRKRLRTVFWLLFVVLTVACVVLNIKVRDGVKEDDCQSVAVRVIDVKKVYNGQKQYTDVEMIKVTVSYQDKEYKLRGAVGFDKFLSLKGRTYDALLYKGKIYYDLPSVKTSTPIGTIYFICLGADFVCLIAACSVVKRKR